MKDKNEKLHVAVTGASSGIGEAIAREWSAAGANVSLVARNVRRLEDIVAELPGTAHIASVDLGLPAQSTAWVDAAEERFGPIDILVNNAGVQIVAPAETVTPEQSEAAVAVNLLSPMRLIQRVLPGMLARRRGVLINIASIAAIVPTPNTFSYNASKAGIAAASEALRGELRGTGVSVLTVYPGPVSTTMEKAAFKAYGRPSPAIPVGDPRELARRIRRATDRGAARLVYPKFYRVMTWCPGAWRQLSALGTPSLRH